MRFTASPNLVCVPSCRYSHRVGILGRDYCRCRAVHRRRQLRKLDSPLCQRHYLHHPCIPIVRLLHRNCDQNFHRYPPEHASSGEQKRLNVVCGLRSIGIIPRDPKNEYSPKRTPDSHPQGYSSYSVFLLFRLRRQLSCWHQQFSCLQCALWPLVRKCLTSAVLR